MWPCRSDAGSHIGPVLGNQLNLFDNPASDLPEGLILGGGQVTPREEAALIARIDGAGLAPFRFHGWLGKRLTASFGHGYDFGQGRLVEAPPMPRWLLSLRQRLALWAGLDPASFVQALVIRYDPGAGIGWHRDRPQFDHVIGLSLGHATPLRLRRRLPDGKFERRMVPLEPRSAYSLTGPARWEWQHAILPVAEPRWSVTFRSLRGAQPSSWGQ